MHWLALLFAWPLAVLAGWLIARLSRTDWPMSVLPIFWLGVLFYALNRHTRQAGGSSDHRS